MPSPIPRKRFSSEEEIIAAIDRALARVAKYKYRASVYEQKADQLLETLRTHPERYHTVGVRRKDLLEQAEDKRRRALNIETTSLPRLKYRLAVFRTELLPHIGFTDRSIPL